MEKIYYNKLCRDKIPGIIREKGFDCEVRQTEHDEYKREIVRKVYEEASGITDRSSREHMIEEIADLVITLDALKSEFGISESDVTAAVQKSISEKGAYVERLYLSWSSDTDYLKNESGTGIDD
jgi:predicted house-cleaning noncanonical NTP pyrophosphatase (MazG superfamily)